MESRVRKSRQYQENLHEDVIKSALARYHGDVAFLIAKGAESRNSR